MPVHLYTILQIVTPVVIFIVTLTPAAPTFPVLIVALVPFRVLVMERWWPREVPRFVNAWACKEGIPEDDENAEAKQTETDQGPSSDLPHNHNRNPDGYGFFDPPVVDHHLPKMAGADLDLGEIRPVNRGHDMGYDWVESGFRGNEGDRFSRCLGMTFEKSSLFSIDVERLNCLLC